MPLPAPTAIPYEELTCDGKDLHRYDSLLAAAQDLKGEDLAAFVAGREDALLALLVSPMTSEELAAIVLGREGGEDALCALLGAALCRNHVEKRP